MHLLMILMVLAIAYGIRTNFNQPQITWQARWQTALFRFLFPSLLLLTTAIALVWMGSQGEMMGLRSGWISYGIGLGFCGYIICIVVTSFWQGWQTVNQISALPLLNLPFLASPQTQYENQTVRVWETDSIFAAQIGFWQPQLVISSGLIQKFDHSHFESVLKHEQAHLVYKDTFWFFCFGCLRQVTFWLPQTENLWQELLLLRELRADWWAAKFIDPLVLAESLLWTVGNVSGFSNSVAANLGQNRLEERIETLLSEVELVQPQFNLSSNLASNLGWLALTCLPFASIFLHS